MKKLVCTILCFMLFVAVQATASQSLSVEIFDKNGASLSLSHAEKDMLESSLPSVRKIIANVKESARGGNNLFVRFQLDNDEWKETSAQINGNAPISWHIRDLVRDEIK